MDQPFAWSGSSCTECQQDHCRGYTMVRTSYHDDAKFARAVGAVQRLALVLIELDRDEGGGDDGQVDETVCVEISTDQPIFRDLLQDAYRAMVRRAAEAAAAAGARCTHDWVVTNDPTRRYHSPIVEDRDALEGADVPAAWRYYRFAQSERDSGLRGNLFVLKDREAIDHLAAAPTERDMASMAWAERARVAWDHWIKVVSTKPRYNEEGNEVGAVSDTCMARRRIRLLDFFDVFLWQQHLDITEVGVEGSDHERFLE